MKRLLLPFGALFLLAFSTPAFANWEAGVSVFPVANTSLATQASGEFNWMVGLHLGYTFWRNGYASWDGISLPNYLTQRLSEGSYGVPSFLNLYDLGLRVGRHTLFGFAEVGLNNLWVYDVGFTPFADMGVNMRAGIGVKLQVWGMDFTATEAYPSFDALRSNLSGIGAEGMAGPAFKAFVDNLIYSVGLNVYFP